MGTNYYAHWTPKGNPNIRLELHICKSCRMFNGTAFPSWQSWKAFLLNGEKLETVKIIDEYGGEIDVATFIHDVEVTPPELRRRQYDYVKTNYPPSSYDYLDEDGFSFYNGGDFS